jgi:transcriptional regulator with XRE-family HTH domain
MAKPLHERLKEARTAAGLLQQQMADRIGVTQALISQWERGVCFPRNHVEAVEREYGVRISRAELLGKAA